MVATLGGLDDVGMAACASYRPHRHLQTGQPALPVYLGDIIRATLLLVTLALLPLQGYRIRRRWALRRALRIRMEQVGLLSRPDGRPPSLADYFNSGPVDVHADRQAPDAPLLRFSSQQRTWRCAWQNVGDFPQERRYRLCHTGFARPGDAGRWPGGFDGYFAISRSGRTACRWKMSARTEWLHVIASVMPCWRPCAFEHRRQASTGG